MYSFSSTHGTLHYTACDMEQARVVQRAWQDSHERPVPPARRSDWMAEQQAQFMRMCDENPGRHPQEIRDEIEADLPMFADIYDHDFRLALAEWERGSFHALFMAMVTEAVVIDSDADAFVMAKVLLDAELSADLYRSILAVSELSFVGIWQVIEQVGYTYRGRPFIDVYRERGKANPPYLLNDPILEIAYRMLMRSGGTLVDRQLFESFSVAEQTAEFARLFVASWVDSFAAEDVLAKQAISREPEHRRKGGVHD